MDTCDVQIQSAYAQLTHVVFARAQPACARA
jgi:hypothetical protein